MQKKEPNALTFARRIAEQAKKAMERLRKLGAKEIEVLGGVKAMYVPGNVRVGAPLPVDMYGTHVAANSRRQKSFLRSNRLGKFRKGK